jgi:hypothetical protein
VWRLFAKNHEQTNRDEKETPMKLIQSSSIPAWLSRAFYAFIMIGAVAAPTWPAIGDPPQAPGVRIPLKMTAGTVFDLNAAPAFPWSHQVRGIAQVSHLGNCRVFFDVLVYAGSGGHAFDLEGTLTATTPAGDKLETTVVGYADPDANDASGSTFTLHYAVTIVGGTGSLAGASGAGEIHGAFVLADSGGATADPTDDPFCAGYAGVATWRFNGKLILPHPGE